MKEIKQSKIDALALEIFNEEKAEGMPVTMEEAQEMARMELGAKEIKRYEKSNTPKKKVERKRKEDPAKREIISTLAKNLDRVCLDDETSFHLVQSVVIKNPEKEITFVFMGENYSVTLTKHRAPK